ncbi:MAG: hypothetical protein WC671_02190 [Candidatus Paceibacterota bacterium]|jgi:hypothetical protein
MENEKINKKINIGAEEIKQIKMTATEKELMLSNILNSPTLSDTPIKSPWSFNSFATNLQKNKLIYFGSFSFMIIIFSSGIGFVYQKSLPGNILYPLKVKVVEPIYSHLMLYEESKAKYESSLATERMAEAENLANQKEIDKVREKQLNDLFIDHAKTLSKTLIDLTQDKSSDNEIKDNIITGFQNQMNIHTETLDNIREQNNETDEEQEEKQEDEDNVKISETARDDANKIRDESEDKDEQSYEESENNPEESEQDTQFIKETTSKTENSDNKQNRETRQQETRENDD